MKSNIEIKPFAFHELLENHQGYLNDILKIQGDLQNINDGNGLLDKLDYYALIQEADPKNLHFGRIFLAIEPESHKVVGYLSCFDDLHVGMNSSKVFPFDHCAFFLDHDLPFLSDLFHLKKFAYVFQIAVLESFRKKKVGSSLIKHFEKYFEQAHILACSLHESQYATFKLLQSEPQKNKYIFLDHYFYPPNLDDHWFRVVKIKRGKMVKKINPNTLPHAHTTIIPIQLNDAVRIINDNITQLGAKVLWSSFFHSNELLDRRFNVNRHINGFFQSLLDAKSFSRYSEVLKELKSITKFLYKKDIDLKAKEDLSISFTKTLNNRPLEIFFFNNYEDSKQFELGDFQNPLRLYIDQQEKALDNLISKHHKAYKAYKDSRIIKENLEKLNRQQKEEWLSALRNYANFVPSAVTNDGQATTAQWQYWKKQLRIKNEEEIILLRGARILKKDGQKMSHEEKDTWHSFNNKVKEIHERPYMPIERQEKWRRYLELHQQLYQMDKLAFPDSQAHYWWCHAMIPINYSRGSNVVGIMFTFRCQKSIDFSFKTKMGNLASIISSTLAKNMLNILNKLQQKAMTEAASRYAIAAITSRNLAHTYGSHILPKLSNYDHLYHFLANNEPQNSAKELANFFAYLRIRTVLLSDMSTSEPVSTVARYLHKNLIKDFEEQTIIKQYITPDEKRQIKIHFRINNQITKKDILIQVPNGDLGASAFYMILENLIRNSLKHEKPSIELLLEIFINLKEEDERGYFIEIYDNIPRPIEYANKLASLIKRDYIEKKVINNSNEIRGAGKGILEIQAAASYLRKKVPGIVISQNEKRDHPFLDVEAKVITEWGNSASLAYSIYLKKPRLALLIDLKHQFLTTKKFENLRQAGIKTYQWEKQIKEPKNVHSHKFTIYFSPEERKKYENRKRFPLRWLLLEKEEDIKAFSNLLLHKEAHEELEAWLWEKWVRQYCRRKKLSYPEITILAPPLTETIINTRDRNKQYVVYDLHGNLNDSNVIPITQQIFYQKFSSSDIIGNQIKKREHSVFENEIMKFELFEAAVTQVIIVDERIQEALLESSEKGTEDYLARLDQMNIFVPDPRLGEPFLKDIESKEDLELWLKNILLEHPIDFVVLHLGFLEFILGTNMEDISNWIDQAIKKLNKRPEIVIISGRGKPHNFPSKYAFQTYNGIAKYIISADISKLHIVKVLFSSRTRVGI